MVVATSACCCDLDSNPSMQRQADVTTQTARRQNTASERNARNARDTSLANVDQCPPKIRVIAGGSLISIRGCSFSQAVMPVITTPPSFFIRIPLNLVSFERCKSPQSSPRSPHLSLRANINAAAPTDDAINVSASCRRHAPAAARAP